MMLSHIFNRQLYWIDRGGFYTIGAATYQDDPATYPIWANYTNLVVRDITGHCRWDLESAIGKHKNCKQVIWGSRNLAAPGFHIFGNECNGVKGHPHIDEPYDRIAWPFKWSDPFSFTVPLQLPKCGGGLDFWPDHTDKDIERYIAEDKLPPHEYLPYEVGRLYLHSGLFPHRIANPGDMGNDEWRITLQGHGVIRESNNNAYVYF
jgi:hypothetical protein